MFEQDEAKVMHQKVGKGVSLEELFHPRGVAVVGVSKSRRIAFAARVVQTLKDANFPAIYPVNPKYDEIFGMRCYPSVSSIPAPVDHVIVSIPAESALALLDECAVKGVKSVHFFTAGFGESGYRERAELEQEMLEKARACEIRIIGPNCVGLFVPGSRLVNTHGAPLEPGPIAVLSQSGGHAETIPLFSGPRGLRFSKVVSYGNALDVDENELLEYFTKDPETEIVAAYIEGVKNGRRFFRALAEAAAGKPVVIYKGGRTEAGKRATRGHTASMTSSEAVFEALCRQLNVIQVYNTEELIDVLVALRFARPQPKGRGVALMGAGGGPSVLASDEMEKAGLKMPPFSSEVQAELKKHLPVAGSMFSNPLDTPNLTTPEAIVAATRVLGKVSDIHTLVYHLGFHPASRWGYERFSSPAFLEPAIGAFENVRQTAGKPVVLVLRPALDEGGLKEFLATQEAFVKAGFPVFYSLHNGAEAMARVVAWNQNRK